MQIAFASDATSDPGKTWLQMASQGRYENENRRVWISHEEREHSTRGRRAAEIGRAALAKGRIERHRTDAGNCWEDGSCSVGSGAELIGEAGAGRPSTWRTAGSAASAMAAWPSAVG